MAVKRVRKKPLNMSRGGVPPVPLMKPYAEQGSGGTAIFGGRVTIKDESPKWIGPQRWRTVSDLAVNTSVIAAGIHYFLNLISHPKWTAKPAEDGGEAKDMADFVNSMIEDTDIPWASIVRQAGVYRFHGYSIQEWIARKSSEREDGNIGLKTIEVRPQHTIEQWAVDDQGTILGVFQRNPQTSQLLGLPRAKFLYLVEDTLTDSPEGVGVLRHLLEPWTRLKQFMALETRAFERDLRGIPIGRAPLTAINNAVKAGGLTQAEATQLISGIRSMIETQVKQSDTGILLDSQTYQSTTQGGPLVTDIYQWSFDLLNGPGLGLAEISNAIERLQREMARIMGVEHLMLGGADSGGSKAVAQDKSRNVYLIAHAVLSTIVATVQKDVLGQIWELNGFDKEVMPTLVAEDIAPRDVVEVTTSLARMAQSGAVLDPEDPVINDVRRMLGVSDSKPPPDPMLTDPMMMGEGEIDPMTGLPIDPNAMPAEGEEPAPGEEDKPTGRPPGKKPKGNAEMQRLPRTGAVGAGKRYRANGHARGH